MNKNQAINALKTGRTLTHRTFTTEEWITCRDGLYFFEDGAVVTPNEFWGARTKPAFEHGWELKNFFIKDKCICGEAVLVEVNARACGRRDNKRPHYPDTTLLEGYTNEDYPLEIITNFFCRQCSRILSQSVPSARYDD
ncbi:hypothetical protein AB6E89_17420 [Vibrio breoganii]